MPRKKKEDAPIPKNMQEFIEYGWDKYIIYRIFAFNLKDSLNNPEDLKQDILLALMSTNYLERYTKEKGSFKTYIFGFIDNFLKKRYNKENTRHGKFIVSAATLTMAAPESDADYSRNEIFAESLDSGEDLQRAVIVHTLVLEIREYLKENYTANSYYTYEGVTYARDPLTVFDLLMQDYQVRDIAKILNVSKQFVYHLMSKIKTCPAYVEFARDMC